jgi:hypothetical protein
MSETEIIIGFGIGLIVGAYGAYLAHPIIEMGVGLMKLQQKENRIAEAEELKAKNDSTNDATQPAAENTTQNQTPTENHLEANQKPTKKPTSKADTKPQEKPQ